MSADPFPLLNAADEEVWEDGSYSWDNSTRPQSDCCVVQQNLAGQVQFKMGGKVIVSGPGQALLFTHRERSSYGSPPGAREPYRVRFVAFLPRGLTPFFVALRRDFGSVVKMQEEGEAARMIGEILLRARSDDFWDNQHLADLLFRLLLAMHREQVASQQTEDPIAYGYHLLNDSAGGLLSIKEIAAQAGISREYFIREYSRRHGRTPGAALRLLRLERARAMLLATTFPLADVAAACGFGGADAFRRSFRQHFGQNPLDLRAPNSAIKTRPTKELLKV